MPKLLEETEIRLELTDLARMTPLHKPTRNGVVVEPARSEGVHLSDILRYIAVKSHILEPKPESESLLTNYPWEMAAGLMWEWFAAALYPSMCWQPGEIELDGVFMSPDGFSDDIGPQVDEFKCTWRKAMNGDQLLEHSLWMWQGQGYAKGLCARLVRWHVWYVNGDYNWHRGGKPRYIRYLIEFTQAEIDQNWKMVLASRDKASQEVAR
jgi:hypothetical protein